MNTRNARTIAAATIAALVIPACATRPENVTASHVSSSRYAERTCKSLARELDEVRDALRAQSAKLNDKATQDTVVTGVGVILFWPVLFALGNNAGLEGDVARLKGEEQAIRRQMREQECDPRAPVPAQAASATIAAPAAGSAAGSIPAMAPAEPATPPQGPSMSIGSNSMLRAPARQGEGVQ